MKFSTSAIFAVALTTINTHEANGKLTFPAPKVDPAYQKCVADYGKKHDLACKDPKYPNCEGQQHWVTWGRCFERPVPTEELAIDPRYQRCWRDFGGHHDPTGVCQDPDYPDCNKGFCYARSTNPMPIDPNLPTPDPTRADCGNDYGSGKWLPCKNPAYPICEGMIHGKQYGRCMSASLEGIKKLGDPSTKDDVVYEGDMIISHNETAPKLKVYEGDAIAGVETWSDAYHFCLSKGRRLPYRHEWCNGKWNHYVGADVWGGRVEGPGHKWTAIMEGHTPAPNTLLQLADVLDENGARDVCKVYVPEVPEIIVKEFDPFCKKPDNCVGKECSFQCPANTKEGFYPDPNDCQAVCYCDGQTNGGSFWEKATEDDSEVWDPWCGESRGLDRDNVPLAGMTGGCKRKEYYVADKSYCDGSNNKERKLWKLTEQMKITPKTEPKVDTVMCVKTAKFDSSQMHPTCGVAWGDPHIVTYDGLRYSCQNQGDHILAKSLDSGFQLQGKFQKVADSSIKGATVMTGFYLSTGRPGEPDIEFDMSNRVQWWKLSWWINGQPRNIDRLYTQLGTQATGSPFLEYYAARGTRMFYYPQSEIQIKITYNFQNHKRLGRYFNIELCLPENLKQERIVGLLGSPDETDSNDWMNEKGLSLPITDTKWKGAFDYCKENWCIEDASQNKFHNKFTCDDEYDPTLENAVKNLDKNSKLFAICGNDPECIMDGMAGGPEVAAHTKKQQAAMKIPETPAEDDEELVEEEEQKRQLEEEVEEKKLEEQKKNPTPAPTKEPTPAPTETPPAPDAPSPEDKVTKKAFSKGDPHFKTFGGELYDFHGECDLVLLHNPDFKKGLGMDIHIRTKISDFWSSIESAVIKLGDDTLEISADRGDVNWLWLNGEAVPSVDLKNGAWNQHRMGAHWTRHNKEDFLVRYKQTSGSKGDTREAMVYLENGASDFLTFKTFKGFLRIDVNWEGSQNYFNSVGLLGSHAHEGKRLGRDGEFIEDVNAFGQEWQVVPEVDGSLFHTYEGAVVGKKCTMPPAYHKEGDDLTVSSLRGRRLGASAIDQAAAEKACNHLVDPEEKEACIFDVIAVQDLSMASTW